MSLIQKLNNLPPKQRRNVLVIGSIVFVIAVSWVLTSLTNGKSSRSPRAAKPEVTVVTPARTTGVEQVATRIDSLEKGQADMKAKFERWLEEAQKRQKHDADPTLDAFGDAGKDSSKQAKDPLPSLPDAASVFDAPANKPKDLPPPPTPAAPPTPALPATTAADSGMPQDAAPAAPLKKTIRLINESGVLDGTQADTKLNKPQTAAKAEKRDSAFIPSGSMFTGVLLNGLDAPTSSVAQKNPTPVVIRVKREALLPNFASIDVRECFAVASGYGQLSSERAMMRTEALSCVRSDGKVIENKIEAYIVGTDGKVGIPGRLVSKQGQMIARSLLAGTLGGLGQALNRSRVPSLNIDPTQDRNLYQSDSLSSIGQSGLAGGIASSTNMIAKFYLDMAKETFPVVEVPAGEVVTLIITRGTQLPLKGSTNLQRIADPNVRQRSPAAAHGQQSNHQSDDSGDSLEDLPRTIGAGVPQAMSQHVNSAVSGQRGGTSPSANFSNGLGW